MPMIGLTPAALRLGVEVVGAEHVAVVGHRDRAACRARRSRANSPSSRAAPSSMEYSVCTCRWTKSSLRLNRLTWADLPLSERHEHDQRAHDTTGTRGRASGEERPAYVTRGPHRGRTHRQSRPTTGVRARSRRGRTPRSVPSGPLTPTSVEGYRSHQARSRTASSWSAGWAPETPYLRSTTKNGTPLIPSARASASSARTASA